MTIFASLRTNQMSRIAVMLLLQLLLAHPVVSEAETHKRPVTVEDSIAMTRLADTYYFFGGSSSGRVARFSPDGSKFVTVLSRGNLKQNTNEYSILLFRTAEAFQSPQNSVLVTMHSSSNRPAIKDVKWLEDNQTITFIGEDLDEVPQIYSLDTKTRLRKRLTNHPTPIDSYDITLKGDRLIFLAQPVTTPVDACHGAMVITTQALDNIPRGGRDCLYTDLSEPQQLFMQTRSDPPVRIPLAEDVFYRPMSLAPNGRYAVFAVLVRNVPEQWKGYQDHLIQSVVNGRRKPGVRSQLLRYMLLDLENRAVTPLIDAPLSAEKDAYAWAPDSQSIVVSGAYLPLDGQEPSERELRSKNSFVVEVTFPTLNVTRITDQNLQVTRWSQHDEITLQKVFSPEAIPVVFRKNKKAWEQIGSVHDEVKSDLPLDVTLEEDFNTPPKIFVTDPSKNRKDLLLDLNPQFEQLKFARVEAIHWTATDGHEVAGALYWPPEYQSGKRYPLVIQTHGFDPHRFTIDGPWSSAFAAQMLASNGIMVLQVGHSTDPSQDYQYMNTPAEASRETAAYEGGIDYLDHRGLIDKARVGIIGFSRTVWKVEFTLTHSSYEFAAATLADGFDAGYLQYLVYPGTDSDFVSVNGGAPFNPSLALWLKNAPGFNLDKVRTPVRIEAYYFAGVLGGWEWFSGLTHLGKPVDLIYLPEATHLLVRPSDRLISQQGNVDWFTFWLKDQERDDAAARSQYERWRALRRLVHPNGSLSIGKQAQQ